MTRIDHLTDCLIDGAITDVEALELHDLLVADPAQVVRHLALVRLELVLRGLRSEFDLAGQTVEKIEGARIARTTTAVMSKLASRPQSTRERRSHRWIALAALAAAVLVGVWLAFSDRTHGRKESDGVPAAPELARLTSVVGSVEIFGTGGASVARSDQTLASDQTLRTIGDDSAAVLEFSDRARVEVHADTAVQLIPAADGAGRQKMLLLHGRITAVGMGGRIVVATGATEMETSRGSFTLCSSGSGSARVESLDGDVRVVRGVPAEPLLLGPGRTAFLRDEQTPIQVERSMRIDTEPRHRLNFMALDVGFALDGEVFAVSAKQWLRLRPGTPDPVRIAFPPKAGNDGHVSWLTPDLHAVAMCRTDDKEERIVIRTLPSGDERGHIPVRVSDPRFLCVAPDASWVATATGQKPNNRTVRVWNVDKGTERFACEVSNMIYCLTASPDGKWLAVGLAEPGRTTENGIVVFDAATGRRAFELPTKRKAITAMAFTSDSKYLAAGFSGAIQLWDVPARKLVKTLEGFERVVTRLAYSPRNNLLGAGTQDGQVWVWATNEWRRRQVIETGTHGVRSLAFSTDGKWLVTATNKAGVAVWEVAPEGAKEFD